MRRLDRTTVVPAEPGWHALIPETEGGRVVGFYREPVIAWTVELIEYAPPRQGEFFPSVEPVTLDFHTPDDAPLLRPDGQVVFLGEADFATEEAAVAYINRRQERGEAP